METEEIKQRIAYIEGDKIKNLRETIDFYRKVGARKDLTDINADLNQLERTVANFRNIIENGPQDKTGIKVKVTEYNGRLVIETVDPEDFDTDFIPNGNGLIGCSLNKNSRLGISEEALKVIGTYKKVGDVIGDLMGEENNFTWIGGPFRILDTESVVCRYFKMPKGYTVIENSTSETAINHIDVKASGAIEIDYNTFEQELWIELSKSGSWKKKGEGDSNMEYVYNDYYTLENREGARFVTHSIYDPELKIVNAPEGMIKTNGEGHRKILMPKQLEKDILEACKNLFRKGDESSWDIKVNDTEIMSYINPLFDLGFDNNVMNPRDGYWRMSIRATPEVILEKLKSFKRDAA